MADSDDIFDPLTGLLCDVRLIQPMNALKCYQCPACSHNIESGVAHFVVVPEGAADLRRHWHRHCWERREKLKPGVR